MNTGELCVANKRHLALISFYLLRVSRRRHWLHGATSNPCSFTLQTYGIHLSFITSDWSRVVFDDDAYKYRKLERAFELETLPTT